MLSPTELMQLAIDKAREGMGKGNSPFGCAIARDGEVLAVAHNTVLTTIDSTAHAEVNAIRHACRQAGGIFLDGCVVATTCEPCPMCMAALHWARVDKVYFGATVQDAATAGFNELHIPAEQVLSIGGSKVTLSSGVLSEECRQLFGDWKQLPGSRTY